MCVTPVLIIAPIPTAFSPGLRPYRPLRCGVCSNFCVHPNTSSVSWSYWCYYWGSLVSVCVHLGERQRQKKYGKTDRWRKKKRERDQETDCRVWPKVRIESSLSRSLDWSGRLSERHWISGVISLQVTHLAASRTSTALSGHLTKLNVITSSLRTRRNIVNMPAFAKPLRIYE